MKYSTVIIYDRKKQAEGGNDGALEVRVIVDRKAYYICTGMRVLRKHWAGAVVVRPDADALNNRLGMIVRRVNEKINEFIEQRKPIDVAAIKEYIYDGTSLNEKGDRMLEWLKAQIPMLDIKEGTRKHYHLLYDRLKQYGKLKRWSDLTVEGIYEWDAWLRRLTATNMSKKDEEPCAISDGTIHNYHKDFKALLNRAIEMGVLQHSPYERLRGKFRRAEYDNYEYLTDEQVELILSLHPVPGTQMETVRDLFVLQMFTGLSYTDAQNFDIKNYHKDGDAWVYNGTRIKTGIPYISQLLPPVIDVLERHGWQVPQMPNQKYNKQLKAFGNVIGIEGLHSHLARHTFATYMLSHGVKVQNVMRMMGHKKIEQTLKYAKVLAKDVHEEFEKVAEKLR